MAAPAPTVGPTRWERRRWLTFLIAFLAVLAPMSLWALASPIGSVPDEPSHAIRAAAVARGEFASIPWPENPGLAEATVPENIANAHALACFAFKSETTTADCQYPIRDRSEKLVTTGSSAGANSPLFYAIVGWPSLLVDGDAVFYAMRLAGAVVSALALAAMFMQLTLLPRWRWAVTGAVVGITPMVLYLGGSINPNGVEVAAAGGLFATLVAMTRGTARGRLLWEQAIIALVTAILLMSTRSISLLWVAIILGVAIFLGTRGRTFQLLRSPQGITLLIATAAIGLATVAWYLNPPALEGEPASSVGLVSYAFAAGSILLRSFDWVLGMIGLFGWVDTPAPSATVFAWSTALVAMLGVSVVWGRRRTTMASWALIVVCLLVPAAVTISVYAQYGYIWQGRYMLAMLICLLICAGLALDDASREADRLTTRLITGGFAALAIGHLFAFVFAMQRFAVGSAIDFGEFFFAPKWQPPLGWQTLAMLFALVLVVDVLLARRLFRAAPTAEPAAVLEDASTEAPA